MEQRQIDLTAARKEDSNIKKQKLELQRDQFHLVHARQEKELQLAEQRQRDEHQLRLKELELRQKEQDERRLQMEMMMKVLIQKKPE